MVGASAPRPSGAAYSGCCLELSSLQLLLPLASCFVATTTDDAITCLLILLINYIFAKVNNREKLCKCHIHLQDD